MNAFLELYGWHVSIKRFEAELESAGFAAHCRCEVCLMKLDWSKENPNHRARQTAARGPVPACQWRQALLLLSLVWAMSLGLILPTAGEAETTDRVWAVSHEIRAAALANTLWGVSHALPLVGHWNNGVRIDGFHPSYQLQQIQEGNYLLPWIDLAQPSEPIAPESYYRRAVDEFAAQGLPISFVSTQWEVLVAKELGASWRRELQALGDPLSPFSPREYWYKAGLRWGQHPLLKKIQKLYPNPPLIVFVSNNEQRKLGWVEIARSGSPIPGLGPNPTDQEVINSVGDAWIDRYGDLIRGFRDGLTAPAWKNRAIFVGYGAFGGSALGRWGGWTQYSLYKPGRFEPWPVVWDGGSVPFYVFNWDPTTDFRVWSPQVQSMNWVPMLQLTNVLRDNFWFEISTWDGQSGNPADDKRVHYIERGQIYDGLRYGGMVQFGMWLLRPRVVREYRGYLQTREQFGDYFDAIMAAVARVHRNPTLAHFWQNGRLLPNKSADHPYQVSVPDEIRKLDRWFLLESPDNKARPWKLDTKIQLYALALEIGTAGSREWLVYSFAPRRINRREFRVQIPGGPEVSVGASRAGCFTHIVEGGSPSTVETC